MKTCPKCGECKPLSGFSKDKSRKDGLQNHCKPCRVQYNKRWKQDSREKNRELYREYNKHWYEINLEKRREYSKCRREEKREFIREYDKRRRESNPEKFAAYNAKRRAAKLQRTPVWLTKEQLDEIETFYTAALAFRLFTGLTYHVDHIIPLQGKNVSGLHVPWNLQVIPATDNLKKSNLFED